MIGKWFKRLNWWATDMWAHSNTLTIGELAVIRALLPAKDVRTVKLLSQAEHTPAVERSLISPDSYHLHIPYVKDGHDLIAAEADVTSPPLVLKDLVSGRKLRFTVRVRRGGFLNDLIGLPVVPSPQLREEIITELARWCGAEPSEIRDVGAETLTLNMSATDEDASGAETRLECRLPAEYKEFVRICNGFSLERGRRYAVFGTADIYALKVIGEPSPLLVLTDLYEQGVVAMELAQQDIATVIILPRDPAQRERIGNLRTYIRDTLDWFKQMRRDRQC